MGYLLYYNIYYQVIHEYIYIWYVYTYVCYVISVSVSEPCEPYEPYLVEVCRPCPPSILHLSVSYISCSPSSMRLPELQGEERHWGYFSPSTIWLVSEIFHPLAYGWLTTVILLKTNSPYPSRYQLSIDTEDVVGPHAFLPFLYWNLVWIENVQVLSMLLQLWVHICMLSGFSLAIHHFWLLLCFLISVLQ